MATVTIFILYYFYSVSTTNQIFGSAIFPELNAANLPTPTQEDSRANLSELFFSEEGVNIANNSLNIKDSWISFSNTMQLPRTEQIQIGTNFSSKPSGLSTYYNY